MAAPRSATRLTFHFDYLSPYSYLAHQRLRSGAGRPLNVGGRQIAVEYKPVLLPALLSHWGTTGPAEVEPKRTFMYEYCDWMAKRDGVPFKCPPAHPFNPLPLLRATIAAGSTPSAVDKVFRYVWREGKLSTDDDAFKALLEDLKVERATMESTEVKQALRHNNDEAVQHGVFGVPTFLVGDEKRLFWGYDTMGMLEDYINGDPVFDSEEFTRYKTLPVAAVRRMGREKT